MVIHQRDIPSGHHAEANMPAAAAGDATFEIAAFVAPFKCAIKKVTTVAGAAVTGADTNYRSLVLYNRGKDGTGTTELARRNYTAGKDSAKAKEEDLYAPTELLVLDAGTVLGLENALTGTGLALPNFLIKIYFEAR